MAVNQGAIDRLRLDEAFSKKLLHRAFDECWTVKCDQKLPVVDDDATRISRYGSESDDIEKALIVLNENKREIVLLSIDNQLLKSVQGGVADCALFDDRQFRLVEFKTNAEGKSDRAIRKTPEKAGKQLGNTISIFRNSLETVDVALSDAFSSETYWEESET